MNDSDIFLAATGSGGTVPIWSSPMELKHLDVVRSNYDGYAYQILNNSATPVTVTTGPGNPTSPKASWLAGWRRINDSDNPGDLVVLRDVGNSNVISDGPKRYLRGGVVAAATETDYPALPINAFSVFSLWTQATNDSTPAATGVNVFSSFAGVTTGEFKGWMMAVSGAAATGQADSIKTWYSVNNGDNWYAGPTLGATTNYSQRVCCNGEKRFYRVAIGLSTVWSIDCLGAGLEGSWTQRGAHGLTAGATLTQGTLEYVGSIGAKPDTDCLVMLEGSTIATTGSNTAIAVSTNGALGFSRPTLFGMNASIKGVMVLHNNNGHVILLAATKTTSPTGVQCWYNAGYGAGAWVDTLQLASYYNVCGGCWDGEKYIIALMISGSVDIFAGVIQPDNSVVFTKISKATLSTYITGDGAKNTGVGMSYARGQYMLRLANKQTIFPSLGALCDATPVSFTPVNGGAFLNSNAFAMIGETCISANSLNIFKSQLSIGYQTPFKPTPDSVETLRLL